MNNVVIGIITFQRPALLAQLLAALKAQTFAATPAPAISVLVVDNDAAGSARDVCDAARAQGQNIIYVNEPVQGIPVARNRVLDSLPDEAQALAWINDNGAPVPGWLETLLTMARETEADIVMGASQAVLPDSAPAWVRRGGFFNRRRFSDYATLAEGASNNCLMRISTLRSSGLRYDEDLRQLGGSDTLFFRRASAAGLRMVWAAEAVVNEQISPARCNLGWLWRRHFRAGNTLTITDLKLDGTKGWLRRLWRATQKLLAGLITLPLGLTGFHELARGLLILARSFGMFAGLLGVRYREPVVS
jgi:GT2 family glycosyltransferase